MAIQVRDTKAGNSISAWVILNKKGEHVATVNAHYSNGGTVTVDVWNLGDKAVRESYAAAMATLEPKVRTVAIAKAERDALAKFDWRRMDEASNWAAFDLFGYQQGRAGGYGYDKFTAALAGLWIDGHRMANHSGCSLETERLLAQYKRACAKFEVRQPTEGQGVSISYAFPQDFQKTWDEKARKLGAHFANFNGGRYQSLYLKAGLERLEMLGYRVIQAI